MAHPLLQQLANHNKRALARAISFVENETAGYEELLQALPTSQTPVIGITGPPGAGKSTLISALTQQMLEGGKKVAVIAIDPSSPFNHGALMGDRVRMSDHFLHPDVFIRSMASRGSLGGLSPKILEVTDVLKAAWFDYIIIETVGVGQSEVEIASLADTTILALVPEAGDDIQTIKSGVMEIADIYVLNKADRDGASTFCKNLTLLAHSHATKEWEAPVIKTIATKNEGLSELLTAIENHGKSDTHHLRKAVLVAEKALTLIKNMRTKDISFSQLLNEIKVALQDQNFNLYQYVSKFK
ncbi:MAG: methylmalonyl Co-A mutase-associated GTPase MeaB [Bacteroidota bacterium]